MIPDVTDYTATLGATGHRSPVARRRGAAMKPRKKSPYRRVTKTAVIQRAGCYVCHGNDLHWTSNNAQAIAARHTDATGHKTWCDNLLSISYEREEVQP